jgi:tetratricopeptide (TPR) repeat protein
LELAEPAASSAELSSGRIASRVAVLATIVIVAGLAYVANGFLGSPDPTAAPDRIRLAVLPADVVSAGALPEDTPRLVQTMIAANLTGAPGWAVLDSLTVNRWLMADGETAAALTPKHDHLAGRAINFLIEPRVYAEAGALRLTASLIDNSSDELLFSSTTTYPDEAMLPTAVEAITRDLAQYLDVEMLMGERDELREWAGVRERNLGALRAFMQATEFLYRYEPGGGEYLARAVEMDPDFILARVWLIAGLVQTGDTEATLANLTHLRTLTALARPHERAAIAWAEAFASGDLSAQASSLEFMLAHQPSSYVLMVNLGYVQMLLGDCDAAVASLQPPADAKWAYPPLYPVLAGCLISLGNLADAQIYLEAASRIRPTYPVVHAILYGLNTLGGHQEAAALSLARWDSAFPSASATERDEAATTLTGLVRECEEVTREACTQALLAQAVSASPDYADARLALGDFLWSVDRQADAKPHYRRYLQLEPDSGRYAEIAARIE